MRVPILKMKRDIFLAGVAFWAAIVANGQTTAFTYSGRLGVGGNPASGLYDFQFQAFDAVAGGNSFGGAASANAVAVSNGLFNVLVDFGSAPFSGPARWLEVRVSTNGAGNFSTLNPRQQLTPTPYAIYASTAGSVTNGAVGNAQLAADSVAVGNLQNSNITAIKIASGQVVKSLNGLTDNVSLTQGANVTINTVGNSLQISAPAGGLALPYSGSVSTSGRAFSISNSLNGNLAWLGADVGVYGSSLNAGVSGQYGSSGNYGLLGTSGSGVFGVNVASGNYGYLGAAGSGVYGSSTATDNRALHGEALGNAWGVFATASGRDAVYGETTASGVNGYAGVRGKGNSADGVGVRGENIPTGNYGQLGTANQGVYGASSASGGLGVRGDGFGAAWGLYGTSDSRDGVYGFDGASAPASYAGVRGETTSPNAAGVRGNHSNGNYGQLGTAAAGIVGVATSAASKAALLHGYVEIEGTMAATATNVHSGVFRRYGNDGELIVFSASGGVAIGSISVSGTTVSYNAFTGSHFGWTDETLDRGMLVRFSGSNRRSGESPDSEIIYGVARTTRANDPRCLGAYLAIKEPSQPISPTNCHLVMAVGNGDMWVTEGANGDLEAGEYLISSDVPGCAMKDDPERFSVGYICARAAESVEWSHIVPSADGVKRKRISVLFQSFERHVSPSPSTRNHFTRERTEGAELATMQRLNQKFEETRAENTELRKTLDELKKLVDMVDRKLNGDPK